MGMEDNHPARSEELSRSTGVHGFNAEPRRRPVRLRKLKHWRKNIEVKVHYCENSWGNLSFVIFALVCTVSQGRNLQRACFEPRRKLSTSTCPWVAAGSVAQLPQHAAGSVRECWLPSTHTSDLPYPLQDCCSLPQWYAIMLFCCFKCQSRIMHHFWWCTWHALLR